jgi:5-methyltetrahydrofolate--homocysteine methyltransferase
MSKNILVIMPVDEKHKKILEEKAAILAAKEQTQLPVICTLTFQKNGRTLMGNDPITVMTVLEGLGVAALGVNCSLGPEDLLPIVKQFAENSHVPVLVQANAGLPELVDGRPVFPLTPDAFADSAEKMTVMGIKMIGGCCGTNPDFIRELQTRLKGHPFIKQENPRRPSASSARQTVFFDDGFRIVGQRINPSGREDLTNALRNGDLDALYDEAMIQKQAGADILDVNVYVGDMDEKSAMENVVEYLQSMLPIPLQLDSSNYRALEAGARVYNGKPIINSVNGSKESMEKIFPIVRKYGACVIGMTMDESGIPAQAEGRLEIARRIVETAAGYGIPKEDILIDCLVQSAAYEPQSARETLKAVTLVKAELGVKTILGISNISYGMKERSALNGTFLAMALGAGLDCAIVDPTAKEINSVLEIYHMLNRNK